MDCVANEWEVRDFYTMHPPTHDRFEANKSTVNGVNIILTAGRIRGFIRYH